MNKQNLHNIVSSIQMSPRDKKDLIKELKSNNVHCIEIFDSNTLELRSFEDVYKEYENNKDKFIIGSCEGLVGFIDIWTEDYWFGYTSVFEGELQSYVVLCNANNESSFYEEYHTIKTLYIDIDSPSFIDFWEIQNECTKIIIYDGCEYVPIASMMDDNCISFLICDTNFHTVNIYPDNSIEIIDIDSDFGNSGTGSLKIDFNTTIEGLSDKITDAIHNGTPIFIGGNHQYHQVLHATCYSFDRGTVYLYTKTNKYSCDSNELIDLGSWEHEKVKTISNIANIKYDDLIKCIENNTILYFNIRLTIVEYNQTNIKAFGLYYDLNDEPIIVYFVITKNETTGNCKIRNYYKTNELKKEIIYIENTIDISSNNYNVIVPTQDIVIKFNKYYTNQYGNYGALEADNLAFKYIGEIDFSDTVYNITFPDIIWSTDSILDFKPNHAYRFEIQECLGIMKEFVLPTE